MSRLKLFRNSTPFIALGVLVVFLLQPGHKAVGTPTFDPRAYIERGDRVEEHYRAYSKRLAEHYAALVVVVKEHAPDLLPDLQPREPIVHGYQILPRIIPDAAAEIHAHASPMAYSWPWTDRLIASALREIDRSEKELRRIKVNPPEHRAILQNLAQNYEQQSRRLRNIQAHVQYNRLWQAAIAADRSGYDRETLLLSDVVERQRVIDRLNRLDGNAETTRVSVTDAPLGKAELAGSLRKREALLDRRIDQTMGQVQTPDFIKLEHLDSAWIFHVPLVTDIEDREYVAAVKKIIENSWQFKDGKNDYRVELDVTYVSADALYGNEDKPSTGQKIDIRRHLKRFPLGAAILTTGALTTHVQSHAIVLGPHPVAPQVLAHEFGHILGFRDRYVRGYRNLGEHGFQVIEVVEDQDDIMAATARGRVHRGHFLKLRQRRAAPASQLSYTLTPQTPAMSKKDSADRA